MLKSFLRCAISKRSNQLAYYYSVLEIAPTESQEEVKSAFLRMAQKHHPDRGGDGASFQLVQKAYDEIRKTESKKVSSIVKDASGSDNSVMLSVFGPAKDDQLIMGDCSSFQNRRKDIYQALTLQNPAGNAGRDDLGHGFIQFLECNPAMVHGFTDLYSLYLNKVHRNETGVILELEDYLAEKTYYLNLHETADYSYSVIDEDDVYIEIDGFDKTIYVPSDIPISDSCLGSHYLIDDLLTVLS